MKGWSLAWPKMFGTMCPRAHIVKARWDTSSRMAPITGAKKGDEEMRITKRLTASLFALGAVVSIGALASQAQAAALFHNSTDRPIVFTMQCGDDASVDQWTIEPGADLSLYCTNPDAGTAIVEVDTSMRDGDVFVVKGPVFDSATYNFFYNDQGAVDITRI